MTDSINDAAGRRAQRSRGKPGPRPSETPSPTAERMRRMRERQKEVAAAATAVPLMYERADWRLFMQAATLPQKAGCAPDEIGRIVLKELVDNALDVSAEALVEPIGDDGAGGYRITDQGPGIDLENVPTFFAVNRPLLSSKLKRLPLRGMLGNGLRVVMGAVAAYGGTIAVTTRAHRRDLKVDPATGETQVIADKLVRPTEGTSVEIRLNRFNGREWPPAELSARLAGMGQPYSGPSHPAWHGLDSLRELFASVTTQRTTVAEIIANIFEIVIDDARPAAALSADEVAALLDRLRRRTAPAAPLGHIGEEAFRWGHYARAAGIARIGSDPEAAEVPFVVECWATCWHADKGENTEHGGVELLLNRSPTLAPLTVNADSRSVWLQGCGLREFIKSGKRAHYRIVLSIITPFVTLMNDGKTPFLGDRRATIVPVMTKAIGMAYRAMMRPPRKMSIVDAAWRVMKKAYLKASAGGRLPANARQIMYTARGDILALAEVESFKDSYFTQNLLPDYVNAHPEECADWDVVFDARGHFVEPHTGHTVDLSTIGVREYLGDRPEIGPAVEFDIDVMFPTRGPEHRYRNILFVEKEGFNPLLRAARIADKFDIAITSTKGMSVVAVRQLLDRLVTRGVEQVLVLHDFDVSGFSILGTLTTDSRRYRFKNRIKPVDLGLRLTDVQALDLQSEPVKIEGALASRADTLRQHGATEAEIDFLLGYDGEGTKRVELNAMTSDVFIAFLERKLAEAGVEKVVPSDAILEQHARRLIEQKLAAEAIKAQTPAFMAEAAKTDLPADYREQIDAVLEERPEFCWEQAAMVVLG